MRCWPSGAIEAQQPSLTTTSVTPSSSTATTDSLSVEGAAERGAVDGIDVGDRRSRPHRVRQARSRIRHQLPAVRQDVGVDDEGTVLGRSIRGLHDDLQGLAEESGTVHQPRQGTGFDGVAQADHRLTDGSSVSCQIDDEAGVVEHEIVEGDVSALLTDAEPARMGVVRPSPNDSPCSESRTRPS